MVTLLAFLTPTASAAELKAETLEAWKSYVQTAHARLEKHLQPGGPFLSIDAKDVRDGEILIDPIGAHIPLRVPGGLIHDWAGAVFFPNATMEDVFCVNRDYAHYKDYFHPSVVAAKALRSADSEDRFSVLVVNRSVLHQTAIDSDYESKSVQVDARHWYTVTRSTRIQEIVDYGEPGEHKLPVGSGNGFIWRLCSITRYEERDGGVYAEVEAMALSRDVPASLRWIVDPMIRRISRSSLLTSLRQTREAVGGVTTARVPSTPTGASSFRGNK